jgi:hypothetical protein
MARHSYPRSMHTDTFKIILAIAYVVFVVGLAPTMALTSAAAWLAFAALTMTPLVVAAIFWKDPTRTLSESIQAARR